MTWAGKLREKKVRVPPTFQNGVSSYAFPSGFDQAKNDLVLAVLEKNRKIQERYKEIKSEVGVIEADIWLQENESLMARQLVQACEKVNKK